MQPYLQWKYESIAFMASYSSIFFMWILNIAFDHNGGWFDHLFYNVAFFNQIMPYITLYGVFNTSSSYGTDKQVSTNTKWALTVNSDPYYSSSFNLSIFSSLLGTVFQFAVLKTLKADYNEKILNKVAKQ